MAENVLLEKNQSNGDIQSAHQSEESLEKSKNFVDSIITEDASHMLLKDQESGTVSLDCCDFGTDHHLVNSVTNQNDKECVSTQTAEKESKLETIMQKLTAAFLTNLLPEQDKLKKQMSDIIQSQNVLIETIEHENSKFTEIQTIKEVTDIMDRARIYQMKLVNIKKEMMLLHEKTNQLKRRALKLQQQKQKEALHREHKRDEELEKEKKLMAKVMLRQT